MALISEELGESELNAEELRRLDELDSTFFGFINLLSPEHATDRILVVRGIRILERKLKESRTKQIVDEETKIKSEPDDSLIQDFDGKSETKAPADEVNPQIYCKLGHLHLLTQDFAKAMSAYQHYFSLDKDSSWKDMPFVYGLGLTYYHFNDFDLARNAFQKVLYHDPSFTRANEVHLRLGLIFKHSKSWPLAFKHFHSAFNDASVCSLSKPEVRFHIADCCDRQERYALAKEKYNEILNSTPNLPNHVKAVILRQLGWLYHRAEAFGEKVQREQLAIQYLQESLKLDPTSGQTWYYLGRCFSSLTGRAHDAFLAYRHSIDKSESSADTWCSIGVLYQQQNQHTDALQAYICAVQLDKGHWAAWVDLGILYENCAQFKDAVSCYGFALKNQSADPVSNFLRSRIKVLETELLNAPNPPPNGKKPVTLPSLEEAWKLPIPAELTTRQEHIHKAKIRQYLDGNLATLLNMRNPDDVNQIANKELKPTFYLSPQQLQLLHVLQQNQAKLNQRDLVLLQQLHNQFVMMQHHMKMQQEQQQFQQNQSGQPLPPGAPSNSRISGNISSRGDPDGFRSGLEQQHGDLPQVTQEDLAALLGSTGDTDDLLGSLGVNDPSGKDVQMNDPLFSAAAIIDSKLGLHQIHSVSSTSRDIEMDSSNGSVQGNVHVHEETFELKPPPPLSLVAPCRLDIRTPMTEVLSTIKKVSSGAKDSDGKPFKLLERGPPPPLPCGEPVNDDKLLIPTPSIVVETKKDATAPELQEFCFQSPIAVIRGLSAALKLDLGLFSTKTLVGQSPEQQVEIRTQVLNAPDDNVDIQGTKSWRCESHRSYTTIAKYAKYQAETFTQAMIDETTRIKSSGRGGQQPVSLGYEPFSKRKKLDGQLKTIKFGTNVDLSDDRKWRPQLQEINRLPSFCKISSASNMLTHLGHVVYGMNTVQLYMKVPGCRTPGHQENNNFASVNINIGPGDCEWFGVAYEYWGALKKLCDKQNLDFLKGSWWPLLDDLAKARIPVYRFTQRPGDCVWVGPATVHWVQAVGWCNNIAWNVGPVTAYQLELAIERYEWNKLEGYKSIVPLVHLCWQMARNIRFSDAKMFEKLKKALLKSFCHSELLVEYLGSIDKEIRYHPRAKGEVTHYCADCELEVFNILFVAEQNQKFTVHCFDCAKKADPGLIQFTVLNQYTREELISVYESFQLHAKVPGVSV